VTRPLTVLALALLVLALAERWLAGRDEAAARARVRAGTLFTLDEASELRKLPAVTLELPGERHRYGRLDGEWRCLSLFDAPCDARAVQELIDAVVQAEGLVLARSVEEAPRYGINTPETRRIVLQGPGAARAPGGDVRATLEVGAGNGQASFARRLGTKEIWSLSSDLGARLAQRVAPELPPLLASSLVPASRREASGGIVRVERQGAGGTLVLARRERELDPAQMQPGTLPWTWVLDPGPGEVVDEGFESLVNALETLSYVGVLDPATKGALGLDAPLATITFRPREGAPLVLAFGARDATGGAAWVAASGTLYRLSAAALDSALAPRELLLAGLTAQRPPATPEAPR